MARLSNKVVGQPRFFAYKLSAKIAGFQKKAYICKNINL